MYFEQGPENFQSSITSASVNHIQVQVQSKFKCDDLDINVNHLQLKSSSSVMTLSVKCQYINDHYQLLVQLHSIIAQSTPKWN